MIWTHGPRLFIYPWHIPFLPIANDNTMIYGIYVDNFYIRNIEFERNLPPIQLRIAENKLAKEMGVTKIKLKKVVDNSALKA